MKFPTTERYSFRSLIKYWLIVLISILMLSFIIFQARFLIMGPQITLNEIPPNPQNARQLSLQGTAHNISRIWLNDRPIYTDAEGNFEEAIVLENGYTIATLRAEDRYGRMTTVEKELVYVPESVIQ